MHKKKKKKPKASFFIHAFGCTTSQQLTLITADWVCTEPSGLPASPQSHALIYRMVRGVIESHFTHISQKGPNPGLCVLSPDLWCSMSEKVPARGCIHCVRLKGVVYSRTPRCHFSLRLLPSQRHHPTA